MHDDVSKEVSEKMARIKDILSGYHGYIAAKEKELEILLSRFGLKNPKPHGD